MLVPASLWVKLTGGWRDDRDREHFSRLGAFQRWRYAPCRYTNLTVQRDKAWQPHSITQNTNAISRATTMKKYIVVENAGYEDEFDVKVCSTAIAADRWIAKHYVPDEIEALRVAVCLLWKGQRNYEF
jgi:hypothetical protein